MLFPYRATWLPRHADIPASIFGPPGQSASMPLIAAADLFSREIIHRVKMAAMIDVERARRMATSIRPHSRPRFLSCIISCRRREGRADAEFLANEVTHSCADALASVTAVLMPSRWHMSMRMADASIAHLPAAHGQGQARTQNSVASPAHTTREASSFYPSMNISRLIIFKSQPKHANTPLFKKLVASSSAFLMPGAAIVFSISSSLVHDAPMGDEGGQADGTRT